MKAAGVFAGAVVLTFLILIGLAACAPEPPSAAASCTVTATDQTLSGTVAGYSGEQLTNAAQIIAAGAALGLTSRDQTIGVMTAMGESSLRVLDYGDAVGPDSRGLFQQRDNGAWGTYSDRMDPFVSATNFFRQLMTVDDRESLTPTEVARQVQSNADADHYAPYWEAAVTVVNAFSDGQCFAGVGTLSADAQQLATGLVAKIDAGRITGLSADVLNQIRWVAAGTSPTGCGVDVRVLQIITVASDMYTSVGISSINRYCTGTLAGAGTLSRHYLLGGGHAVDFYSLGGMASTGADANSVALIRTLDTLMPDGSMVGQIQCRAAAGTTIQTSNLEQFEDTCNHLHIDVDPTTSTLLGS